MQSYLSWDLQLLKRHHAFQSVVFDGGDVVHVQAQNLQVAQSLECITGYRLDLVVLQFQFDQIDQPHEHTGLILNGPGNLIVVQLSVKDTIKEIIKTLKHTIIYGKTQLSIYMQTLKCWKTASNKLHSDYIYVILVLERTWILEK